MFGASTVMADTKGAPVTVVVRCYQQGRFLRESIASVNAQTVPPSSIVVVNDGSTDCTADVVREHLNNVIPITVITRGSPKGAVRSLNDGFDSAGTEFVCALDADDRLSPNYLECTLEALRSDPDAAFAFGQVRAFGSQSFIVDAAPLSIDDLLVENRVPITALLRRRVYLELGPFDVNFDAVGFEDWEYWLRLVSSGRRGVPVNHCWLEYRRHDSGSRNTVGLRRSLTARSIVWRRYRRHLRPTHVARWARSVALATLHSSGE